MTTLATLLRSRAAKALRAALERVAPPEPAEPPPHPGSVREPYDLWCVWWFRNYLETTDADAARPIYGALAELAMMAPDLATFEGWLVHLLASLPPVHPARIPCGQYLGEIRAPIVPWWQFASANGGFAHSVAALQLRAAALRDRITVTTCLTPEAYRG